MNIRQNKLLLELIDTGEFRTVQYYADHLSCSEKTVREDVKILNSWLKEQCYECLIDTQRGKGMFLQGNTGVKTNLKHYFSKSTFIFDQDLIRLYDEVILLLFDEDQFTVDAMAQELYTNAKTISEDFRNLEYMLDKFDLKLTRRPHLSIEGDEKKIRNFVIYYFYTLSESGMSEIISPKMLKNSERAIAELVNGLNESECMNLSYKAVYSVVFYCKIMAHRIRNGHTIEFEKVRIRDADFEKFFTRLQEELSIQMPEAEKDYFYYSTVTSTKRSIKYPEDFTFDDYDIRGALRRFVVKLGLDHGILVDSELNEVITKQLTLSYYRSKFDFLVRNPLSNEIKIEMFSAYLILVELFSEDEVLRDLKMHDLELQRLAMLLYDIYYTTYTGLNPIYCVIICNGGNEQHHILKKILEEVSSNIKILDIVTSEKANEYIGRVDLAFTSDTMHSGIKGMTVIGLKPFIKIQQKIKLIELIKEISNKKYRTDYFDRIIKIKRQEAPERDFSTIAEYVIKANLVKDSESISQTLRSNYFYYQDTMIFPLYGREVEKSMPLLVEFEKKCCFENKIINKFLFVCIKQEDGDKLYRYEVDLKTYLGVEI